MPAYLPRVKTNRGFPAKDARIRFHSPLNMTTRKPRPAFELPSWPKAVPYPPEHIWRTHADGASLKFRGNTFVRRGDTVVRVFDESTQSNGAPAPKA